MYKSLDFPFKALVCGATLGFLALNAAAQVYNETTRQLSLSTVQVGSVSFPNVVVRLDSFVVLSAGAPVPIISLPAAGTGVGSAYSEATRQLALDRVQVGAISYPNVVVRLDGFVVLAAGTPVPAEQQPTATGGYRIDLSQREAARLFYNAVYQSSNGISSGWTGSIAGCVAGDTSASYKDAVLRRINWFRAMAGIPAGIQFDATFNRKAQQAALVMAANNILSHYPPVSWTCNNLEATEAAGISNLALGRAGPDSISAGYIQDEGSSNAPVGHRRWILYPQTQTMGTGDVTGKAANALWTFDGRYSAARPSTREEFVAWPPPGYVPYQTVYPRWSFSFPKADFSAATVTMRENGSAITTRIEPVTNGYGENTIVWIPGAYADGMAWARPNNDTQYTVQVNNVKINGASRNFSYAVNVFNPEIASQNLVLNGSDTARVGQSTAYNFTAFPGATSYQWRSLQFAAATFLDGAEGGLSQFTASTSPGYSVQVSGIAASGNRSFHLAHPQFTDQTLTLLGEWVPTAQTTLRFASRLALASANQRALVEVSSDGGSSWNVVFEQAGTQSGNTSNFGEVSFTPKQLSLAAYSGKTIQVRFRYSISTGSFYPQVDNSAGWFVDDIAMDGINRITSQGAAVDIGNSNQLNVTPAQAGGLLVQVRPGMFGWYGGWSAAKSVTVQR